MQHLQKSRGWREADRGCHAFWSAAVIPLSGASFNARERCTARDYRPRSVGWRMKFKTWLGKSPKYNVPATVKAKTKFTVSGNPTGAADFASALDSRMYITTMSRR